MSESAVCVRNVQTQSVGAIVSQVNHKRMAELYRSLYKINIDDVAACRMIDKRVEDALRQMAEVRQFVGVPGNILGSDKTKHGEIAEHFNVAFENARDILRGKKPAATFDNIGRTAPADYMVNEVLVQSKYINGANSSLQHVLQHLETYSNIDFGRDGSYYVIPKDYYELILKIISGKPCDLNDKSIRAILSKVKQIEDSTGRTFTDVVRAGHANYGEVQKGAIHRTIAREERAIRNDGERQKDRVKKDSEKKSKAAHQKAKPSMKEATKVAGTSAAIYGSFQFAYGIYKKCNSGARVIDFIEDDWKELGVDTAKAAVEGGISGYAIYALTNVTHASAPASAAMLAFAFGTVDLIHSYIQGEVTCSEFSTGCAVLGIQAIFGWLGATLGGKCIPIPVLGEAIGSAIASNILEEILGHGLHEALYSATEDIHNSSVTLINTIRTASENQQFLHRNTYASLSALAVADKNIDEILSTLGGKKK